MALDLNRKGYSAGESNVWPLQVNICRRSQGKVSKRHQITDDTFVYVKKKLFFFIYTFKMTNKQKIMVSAKVWATCGVYSTHCPLWRAENRREEGVMDC